MDAEDDEPTQGEADVEGGSELEARAPTQADLVALCARLNELGAKYLVVGGFAIMQAGYPRATGDVDLLIDVRLENEALVFKALEIFPDQIVRELKPGEVEHYGTVRVADEIVIDLMKSACGIAYEEASQDVVVREIAGIPIPFASPRLLWRMKARTHREKDAPDLLFLRQYFELRGEKPPE